MKGWLVLGLKISVVLFVPGALMALGVACLVRARRRSATAERAADVARRYSYIPGMEKHDDSLRLRSQQRREQAHQVRREAVQIETGGESEARRRLRLLA